MIWYNEMVKNGVRKCFLIDFFGVGDWRGPEVAGERSGRGQRVDGTPRERTDGRAGDETGTITKRRGRRTTTGEQIDNSTGRREDTGGRQVEPVEPLTHKP